MTVSRRRLDAFFTEYMVVGIFIFASVGLALRVMSNFIEISVVDAEGDPSTLFAFTAFLFVCLYFIVSEVRSGATIGKNFFGLHVTGSPRQIIIRNILKFFPVWLSWVGSVLTENIGGSAYRPLSLAFLSAGILLGLFYIASLFIGPEQALYDRLSGTTVTYHPTMDSDL